MSYPQFGYSYPGLGSVASSVANSQILVPGSISTPTTSASSSGCCESGRPVYTDPHTGQTICSCQYSSSLFSYPRVPGLTPDGVYPSHYSAGQGYMGFSSDAASLYSSLTGATSEGEAALRGLGAASAGAPYAYPYDPTLAAYSYGPGYGGMDINGSRRKNATRETTATLKAWLYEHRKNPYPTKGEKIMLAIITKMTLTQVSTWFANARRRLKKENKMTWSPRNRCSDDADDKDDAEDKDDGHKTDDDKGPEDSEKKDDGESAKSDIGAESPLSVDRPSTTSESPKQNGHSPAVQSQSCDSSTSAESQKPRIWSLADVATSEKRTSTSLFTSSLPNLRPPPNGGFKYLPPLRGWMDPFIRTNGGSPYPPMPRPSLPSFNMATSGTPGLGSVSSMSSSAAEAKPNPFMAAWNSKPMPAVEPTVDSATNAGLHEKSDKAGEGDRREDNEQTKTAFKPVFKRI